MTTVAMGKARNRKRKSSRQSVDAEREEKIRHDLRRYFPSESWIDATFISIDDADANGNPLSRRLHDPNLGPPAAAPGMVVCALCGRLTPPNHLEHFSRGERHADFPGTVPAPIALCADHKSESIHNAWGRSPSAAAIAAIQDRNLRIRETKLPPENDAALRREIKGILEKNGGSKPAGVCTGVL